MDWVPHELDPENDHHREVFAHAGVALYMAQVLEHGLANVMLLARAGGAEFRTPEDYERVLDELLAPTMGRQIREALKIVSFSDAQIAALRDALQKRNFLVHEFFRERVTDFVTANGRNRMIAELDEIRGAIEMIDADVQELALGYAAKHGISREAWQAEVNQLIAAAKSANVETDAG